MTEFTNRGTMMHVGLSNCTVINRGTIMHLNGNNIQVENRGTIMHNNGGRVIVMGSGVAQQQPQPEIKERVIYRDRVVYRDKIVYKTDKSKVEELKIQIQKLKVKIDSSENATYLNQLENEVNYYKNRNAELKQEVEDLRTDLENTSRMRLLREIENLKESLKRSENRERISRDQQYERGYQAGVVDGSNKKKEVFDWGVRPSKEQAAALLSQLKLWLDCED